MEKKYCFSYNLLVAAIDFAFRQYFFVRQFSPWKIEDTRDRDDLEYVGLADEIKKLKSRAEYQDAISIDEEELEAFRKWQKEQEVLKEVGF